MSTENISKINKLLSTQPQGTVLQSFWLKGQGYSTELQKRYRKSRWLETVGSGAMKRTNDAIGYEGAIYAMQKQSGTTIHPGASTALSLLGLSHYLEFEQKSVTVFGGKKEKPPRWFRKYDWGIKVHYYTTSFLPPNLGLVEKELKYFSIKISNAPRAIMECLYLVPNEQDLMECFHFMENMNNIRPALIQELLEKCESIKVKRLFLYLAEKTKHDWFARLDLAKVDLGNGKRTIIKNGKYDGKYQITVSKELEENDKRGL